MSNTMTLRVLGASRYSIDGLMGAKIFTQQDSDKSNDNVCGIEVVEYSAEYELFETLRGLSYPVDVACGFRVHRGRAGKPSVRIFSVAPQVTGKAKAAAV